MEKCAIAWKLKGVLNTETSLIVSVKANTYQTKRLEIFNFPYRRGTIPRREQTTDLSIFVNSAFTSEINVLSDAKKQEECRASLKDNDWYNEEDLRTPA